MNRFTKNVKSEKERLSYDDYDKFRYYCRLSVAVAAPSGSGNCCCHPSEQNANYAVKLHIDVATFFIFLNRTHKEITDKPNKQKKNIIKLILS